MLSPEEQIANHVRDLVRLLPGGELDEEICLLTDESLCNAAVHFKELLEAELRQKEQAWGLSRRRLARTNDRCVCIVEG